jgi:hypothetical protein
VFPGSQINEPVFNRLVDIKRVAPRINDMAGGIRAQFDQVTAQKTALLLIGFPDNILNLTIYFFRRKVQQLAPYYLNLA